MPEMYSPPPPPPPPPPPSSPAEFSLVLSNSSSSSSSVTEEDVNQGIYRRFSNRFSEIFNRDGITARRNVSMACGEQSVSCFGVGLAIWFIVSVFLIGGVYKPHNVWFGPNSSILVEPDPIFVKSVKVKELDGSISGIQLFGFYKSPPLNVTVNWSDSRLLSVSHKSSKVWPFYLNEGTSLNISYNVKPEGALVHLVVNEGAQGVSEWFLEEYEITALSYNLIRGSGMTEVKISMSSSYSISVVNMNMKDVEVELDIDVGAVLYDTKQSVYKCTFSNGECTFNAMSLSGSYVVLTSPAPRQGASSEEYEWSVRLSYQPRWISYVIGTGLVTWFMLLAIYILKYFQSPIGGRYQTENDSARTRLLANKDDDGSSMGSSNDSFAADDADLEEFMGKEGEANKASRRLCAICFDAPRDCFFQPCGHCVSCYQCGTKIAEASGSCPICRKKMKKVKRIYTV